MSETAADFRTSRGVAPTWSSWLPGLAASAAVAGAAYGFEAVELHVFGRAWLEALVLAILLGTVVRSLWSPSPGVQRGIGFTAKVPLEIAVALLGVSLSVATLRSAGIALILGIAGVVAAAILFSLALARLAGLPRRMALLVACGNAICGNSAIAAVAPVIDAEPDDVTAAIAFTAALGVVTVLGLPLIGLAFGMTGLAYGAFAGLTVYAVPQVIAAAAPFGATAIQVGTLVKLVRVLMLGPVCLMLALVGPRGATSAAPAALRRARRPSLVPWFIVVFAALAGLRMAGLVPEATLAPISATAGLLTVVAMAALGLSADVRDLLRAGGRVVLVVVTSLAGLGALSAGLLHILGMI